MDHRRMHNAGVDHAGNVHIETIYRLARYALGYIQALVVFSDYFKIVRLFQLRLFRYFKFGSVIREFAIR